MSVLTQVQSQLYTQLEWQVFFLMRFYFLSHCSIFWFFNSLEIIDISRFLFGSKKITDFLFFFFGIRFKVEFIIDHCNEFQGFLFFLKKHSNLFLWHWKKFFFWKNLEADHDFVLQFLKNWNLILDNGRENTFFFLVSVEASQLF